MKLSKQYPEGHALHGRSAERIADMAKSVKRYIAHHTRSMSAVYDTKFLCALAHEHDRLEKLADGNWKARAEKAEAVIRESAKALDALPGSTPEHLPGLARAVMKCYRDGQASLEKSKDRRRELEFKVHALEDQRELDRAAIRKKDEHIAKLEAERDAKPAPQPTTTHHHAANPHCHRANRGEAVNKQAQKWWVRWYVPGGDSRPVTVPTPIEWWCSGYSDTHAINCGIVHAGTEAEALTAVRDNGWPECEELDFCNAVEPDWRPGSRFPSQQEASADGQPGT